MTLEQQRLALAKAFPNVIAQRPVYWSWYDGKKWIQCLHDDPLQDLNAVHEVEKALTTEQQVDYWNSLMSLMPQKLWDRINLFNMLHVTAPQRVEAILKTLSLWTEEEHKIL